MAVWALMDFGIRVVIGPSFGDIFFENCFKNGALAVVLPADVVAGLRRALHERPGATLTVDLPAQTITGPGGDAIRFEIDAFRKDGLLTGQDEVEMTLARLPAIEAFEARRRDEMPWLG
jgi:3-isopropylmalate/(R)-2-methylmalate dehydratase small subunit